MNESEGSNSEQTAKYNESSLQLMRLHEIWLRCNRYQTDGNLIKLKWELMNAWIELSAAAFKMDSQNKLFDSKKGWVERMNELRAEFSKVNNREELHDLLFRIQLFLRLLQDRSGKGTKWVDSDEDDIE